MPKFVGPGAYTLWTCTLKKSQVGRRSLEVLVQIRSLSGLTHGCLIGSWAFLRVLAIAHHMGSPVSHQLTATINPNHAEIAGTNGVTYSIK